MSKLFCLYWVPGSCGDILHQTIGLHQDWYTGSSFILDCNGRSQRTIDQDLKQTFPAKDNQWLWRSWTVAELDLLEHWSTKNVMFGTHSIDQLRFIKQHFGPKIVTVGVTYGQELFPAVLKNFCSKVAESDTAINQIYKQNQPEQYKLAKQHNLFGAWVLKDFLQFGGPVPYSQSNEFDIEIKLGSVLLGNLEWFNQWLNQESAQRLQQWSDAQDPLYKYKISNINNHYIESVGFNPQATCIDTSPIELDNYHHALIHYKYPEAPHFNTHYDFKYFLESRHTG